MKYITTILALTGLTTIAIAAPADPVRGPSQGDYCGKCVLQEGGQLRELRTSANTCNTLAEGEHYSSCTNQYCGVCIVHK